MFTKTKKFDSSLYKPVLHKSICTGEAVLGFKAVNGGKFIDICLVRSDKDISDFCREYGLKREQLGEDW